MAMTDSGTEKKDGGTDSIEKQAYVLRESPQNSYGQTYDGTFT